MAVLLTILLTRGSSRFLTTPSLSRLLRRETVGLNPPARTPRPVSAAAGVAAVVRAYSSDQGPRRRKMVVLEIPDPYNWIRTRIYFFLIRAYLDQEFSIEEFSEGAKQAFFHVSRLLSQCQFGALEGLVAADLIQKLEEKCRLLSSSDMTALSADPDQLIHTATGDVRIHGDDDGRRFVSILLRFWYLTNAHLPDPGKAGTPVKDTLTFKVTFGEQEEEEHKMVLTANYEFQREFTEGAPPDWTITRIEHGTLID
ncbi:m-AAA protease-interacting protein 1, mitochondrial [Aulostomus maculatus]